ncbi:MAG TPA: hypothetical protein DER04_05650, partial [Holosporales bacterium]|nr:hypothetical protein [Holosporales bacterium]
DYDRALADYTSAIFWPTFDTTVCREEEAIGLLKEFCITPYMKALRSFERGTEARRQAHIERLRHQRQARVEDIGKRTALRAREVISSFVRDPEGGDADFVVFDFAYHKDYYDHVCGGESIIRLATDPVEQEIVRQHYAGFIARHSHEQMMRWQQRFSGVEDLKKQLEVIKKESEATKQSLEPLIKARKAEEELQRQREAEEEEAQRKREAEQRQITREKAEKVDLCSLEIEKAIQYIKDLQSNKVTWGELLKVLEAPDMVVESRIGVIDRSIYAAYKAEVQAKWTYQTMCDYFRQHSASPVDNCKAGGYATSYYNFVKKIIEKKMEEYRALQSTEHPLRNEFSEM